MGALLIILWAAVLVMLSLALVTAPRWCFRSRARHRLWVLRDSLVDEVLSGTLPAAPAVLSLQRDIEVAIECVTKMRLLDVEVFRRLLRGVSNEARTAFGRSPRDRDGLGEADVSRLQVYEARLWVLVLGSLLVGSWFGVAIIGRAYLAAAVRGSRSGVGDAVQKASETRLGKEFKKAARDATRRFRDLEPIAS